MCQKLTNQKEVIMTQHVIYKETLEKIQTKEKELYLCDSITIKKAFEMMQFLQLILNQLKKNVLNSGFKNQYEEIEFFKVIKPTILSKLIFYNKIYRIETNCPLDSSSKNKYYIKKIAELNNEYKKFFCHNDFYKYYNAKRIDKDVEYFTLGKLNLLFGINSFAFEIDPLFSTYYDYKVSRIIGHELLQNYLQEKIRRQENSDYTYMQLSETLIWSESQNALIELIYALHVTGSINHGKGEIRKIAGLFQGLFGISLIDIHHAFHRMKTRAKSRTSYLDKLKETLEVYMDRSSLD